MVKREEISFSLGENGDTPYSFTVTQLPPTKAIVLSVRFIQTLGAAFGEIFSLGGDIAKADVSKLGGGLQKALAGCKPEDAQTLIDGLLQCVSMSGNGRAGMALNRDLFDGLFLGFNTESLQLLGMAVKVNFTSFFPASGGKAAN